jgi:hypothetical protein
LITAEGYYPVMPFVLKGSPDAAVKLLPYNHVVMGLSPENSLLQKMQGMRT